MKIPSAFVLAILLASPAAAQNMTLRIQGKYTLSGVSEGAEVCKLTLTDQPAIGGWSVVLGKDCYGKFGLSRDIAAWTAAEDGAVLFIDPLRKRLLKFDPVEIGGYVAERPGAEPISLDRETDDKPLTAQQRMSGDWSITGIGGDPKCSFASAAAPGGKSGTLTMKPGCAAKWRAKGWASWKLTGTKLTLYDAKGAVLQVFKEGDIVTYEADDASGEPIYYSRD